VTRGRYYTVSGKTPQLVGVISDIVVPGSLSQTELGEKYAKYPLENDRIKENFDDDLSDVPTTQRGKIRLLYKFDLQKKVDIYSPYLATLQANTNYRLEHDKNYQNFLKELKKEQENGEEMAAQDSEEEFGKNDLQLIETYNIMKDLLFLMCSQAKSYIKPLHRYVGVFFKRLILHEFYLCF
jgi:carboxyl-terminal processing protease